MNRQSADFRSAWIAVGLALVWPAWAHAQTVNLNGPTFATLDPALLKTTGFGTPSYSAHVPPASPATASDGDLADHFVAPDTQAVTVIVKAPVTTTDVHVPAIAPQQDPAQYFVQAIATASPHTRLIFPAGRSYSFAPVDCQSVAAHLVLNGLTDLVIDGNGSTLNFASPCSGIAINGATRIVFKNFVIDWPNLQIASLGTVIATGGNGTSGFTYDLKLDSQYIPNAPAQIEAATAWDGQNNYWSLDHPQDDVSYGPPQALSPTGTTRGIPSFGVSFHKGERLLVRHYAGEGVGIVTGDGQDVTFDHMTIVSSPGGGFFFPSGRGLHITNSAVTRAPGRPISTSADAVHVSGAVTGDIVIENSIFAYQGDDGLNINTEMAPIPPGATRSVKLTVPSFANPSPGDTLGLFGPSIGFDRLDKVTAVANNPRRGTSSLTLDQPIPSGDAKGFAANLAHPAARYVVRNNQYIHNRARGVLLQSAYGLVQHNSFVGQTLFSIYLITSAFWHEGPGAQDLLVIDNDVSQTGRGGGLAAVTIAREDASVTPVYVPRSAPAPKAPVPAIHQNVIFTRNRITNVPGAGFYISSANNILLADNSVEDTVLAPVPNRFNTAPNIDHPVVINDATNIVLIDNAVAPGRSGQAPIAIDPNTTSGVVVKP